MADPGTVLWVAGGLGTALTALSVWAWNDVHKRIDKVGGDVKDVGIRLDGKADKVEMDRQRDNVAELYRNQGDLRKDMSAGFTAVREDINEKHIKLLEAIHNHFPARSK